VQTYGQIPANPQVETRSRPQDPPHEVARRITMKDARAGHASFQRAYFVPSYVTAKPGEAEALDLLMNIVGDGSTGRLFRKLVIEEKVAASAVAGYSGGGLDSGAISLHAVAPHGDLDSVEHAVDRVLEEVRREGVTELELERAKKQARVRHTFDSDEQEKLARRYGFALTLGMSIEQIENWPAAIAKVTAEEVRAVANTYLDARRSVTGWLLPEGVATVAQAKVKAS
jgi:zinc protease